MDEYHSYIIYTCLSYFFSSSNRGDAFSRRGVPCAHHTPSSSSSSWVGQSPRRPVLSPRKPQPHPLLCPPGRPLGWCDGRTPGHYCWHWVNHLWSADCSGWQKRGSAEGRVWYYSRTSESRPLNRGHLGISHFVLCWEVVLFSEVKYVRGCPFLEVK